MIAVVGLLIGGNFVYAQNRTTDPDVGGSNNATDVGGANNGSSGKLVNPLKAESIEEVIFLAVDLAVYVGTAFAVLAIIFVGFKFVWAQGKPEEIKDAQRWLLYIVVGLAILISAKVIVTIVENTLVDSGVVNQGVFRRQ